MKNPDREPRPFPQARNVNHLSIPEEFKQGIIGDYAKAEADIRVLLGMLKTAPEYSIPQLNQQDEVLKVAKFCRNSWQEFPITWHCEHDQDPNEQSLLEKCAAITIRYGNSTYTIDCSDPRGMYTSQYSCGPFSIRFITNAGSSPFEPRSVFPVHTSVLLEEEQ